MRRSSRRPFLLLISVATAAGLLAGCSDNGSVGTTAAAPAADAPAVSPAPATPQDTAAPAGDAAPAAAATPDAPAASAPAGGPAPANSGSVAPAGKPAPASKGAASTGRGSGSAAAPAGTSGAAPRPGSATPAPGPGIPAPGASPAPGGNPGATDVGVTADEIRMGSISMYELPVAGNLVRAGAETVKAVTRVQNDTGGLYGRRIKYIDCDDGAADATRHRACYKKLAEQDKIFAFLGGLTFAEADQTAQLQKDGIPWVASGSLYQVEWDTHWAFPIHMSMQHEAITSAKWVRDIKRPKTFGLVCLKAPEFRATCDRASEVLTKAGAKMVHRVDTEVNTPDMSGDVLALRAANPEVVLHYTVNPASTIRFVVDASQQNYWPPKGVTGNHIAIENLGDLVGDYPAKHGWNINNSYKIWGADFVAWTLKYTPNLKGKMQHIQVGQWAGARMFMDALKEAGPNLTRARVMAILNSRQWDTGPGLGQKYMWEMAQRTRTGTINHTEYMYKYVGRDTYAKDTGEAPGLVPDPDKFVISIDD